MDGTEGEEVEGEEDEADEEEEVEAEESAQDVDASIAALNLGSDEEDASAAEISARSLKRFHFGSS